MKLNKRLRQLKQYISTNFWEGIIILTLVSVSSLVFFSGFNTENTAQNVTVNNTTAQSTPAIACKEEATLKKIKDCTFLIESDQGHGSGFVINSNYIVTNRHVVAGAKELFTWSGDGSGKSVKGKLILWGVSDEADLAVLKTSQKLESCPWADSDKITLAETLYAIGWPNSPEGESSITKGIFSRILTAKEGPQFLQTDTPLNPGNSGGPLINKCGVVGINVAKISWADPETPTEGFGFALASNYAKPIIEKLIASGAPISLPIKDTTEDEYTANESVSQCSPPDTISSWVQARDDTRELASYWNNINTSDYDGNKLTDLKTLISKMNGIIETVVPKIIRCELLTQNDIEQTYEWESLNKRAINLEGQLDRQDYTNGYYHNECKSYSCSPIKGRGKDKCSSYIDCEPKYHYTCQNMACVRVSGDGNNDCYLSSDCYHYTCDNMSCKKVEGKGVDECYYEGDPYSCKHSECKDGKCIDFPGKGTNQCYSDYSCQ